MTTTDEQYAEEAEARRDNFLCAGLVRNTTKGDITNVNVSHRCLEWSKLTCGYKELWEDVNRFSVLKVHETKEAFDVRTTTGVAPCVLDEWLIVFDQGGKTYFSEVVKCRLDKKLDEKGNVILEVPTLSDFFVARPGKDRVCTGKVKVNKSVTQFETRTRKMKIRGHIDVELEF